MAPKVLTASECVLRAHGMTGYETDEGTRVVLNQWFDTSTGKLGSEWENIPGVPEGSIGIVGEDPLMDWLGY